MKTPCLAEGLRRLENLGTIERRDDDALRTFPLLVGVDFAWQILGEDRDA